MLNIKKLVFKERLMKKLIERYIRLYIVKEVILRNMVKLKLLAFMRIHPVVNVNRIVKYRKPVKEQKVEKPKSVKVNKVEE